MADEGTGSVETQEQPASPTLNESLSEVWEEMGEDDVQAEDASSVLPDTHIEGTEEKQDQSEPEPEVAEEAAEESGEEDDTLEAPQHWSQVDRETFHSLDSEGQDFLLRRHREMEADYTRKTQDISEIRKAVDEYKGDIDLAGLTPGQAIRNLLAVNKYLRESPQEAVQWIAQSNGVNLQNQNTQDFPEMGEDYDDYSSTDPEVDTLRQEINMMKQQQLQQSTSQANQEKMRVEAVIEAFKSQKDTEGNLKHPYFQDLEKEMAVLANADRMVGKNPDIHDLYERAVWSNPDVRKKKLSEVQKSESANTRASKKAKLDRARKASSGVRGGTSTTEDAGNNLKTLSIKDELAAAWDDQSTA